MSLPCTAVHIESLLLDIAPGRLATLLAALNWARSELAHILGQTDEQMPHQRKPPSPPVLYRLLQMSPVRVSSTVQSASLRLRGVSPMQPALELEMKGLGADAVRLPDEAAVGLSVRLPQLCLSLTGLPESPDSKAAAPEEQPERVSHSPKAFVRSASAPSPPLRRTETAASNLEVQNASLCRASGCPCCQSTFCMYLLSACLLRQNYPSCDRFTEQSIQSCVHSLPQRILNSCGDAKLCLAIMMHLI